MTTPKPAPTAAFVPLLVIGIVLNTLGIVFTGFGNVRYVFMVAGLALMLVGVVKMLASRGKDGGSPPQP